MEKAASVAIYRDHNKQLLKFAKSLIIPLCALLLFNMHDCKRCDFARS
jgi:hypothetical protein